MVLKVSCPWGDSEEVDKEEAEELTDGGSESCDSRELLAGEYPALGPHGESPGRDSTSTSPNPPTDEDDHDVERPPVKILVRDASLDIKRTASAPPTGQEREEPHESPQIRAQPRRQRNTSEGSSVDDVPDSGPPDPAGGWSSNIRPSRIKGSWVVLGISVGVVCSTKYDYKLSQSITNIINLGGHPNIHTV